MTAVLHFKQKTLDLSTPRIMGVLNVTPDSFSDGGRFNNVADALNHATKMIQYGADIIDIGGESTRPNAPVIDTDTELNRVIEIISAIHHAYGDKIWISVDTSNPVVMAQAISAGADIINDVRGLTVDGARQTAAALGCPVVIMHSRGAPDAMTRTMNDLAVYGNVIADVIAELDERVNRAMSAGVRRDNVVIDVGMGFAKAYHHHVALMQNLDKIIVHFGLPMLFGVSRKRFLGELLDELGHASTPADRDMIGTTAHLLALQKGAHIVRVHDVASMVQARRMWEIFNKNPCNQI